MAGGSLGARSEDKEGISELQKSAAGLVGNARKIVFLGKSAGSGFLVDPHLASG